METKITAEGKSIELLETSVTKIFTAFVSGKTTQDAFLHKKDVINDTITRKRSDIEKWREQLRELTDGRADTENAIAALRRFRSLEALNHEVVNLLIDRILVHGENDIEIVWSGRFGEQVERP